LESSFKLDFQIEVVEDTQVMSHHRVIWSFCDMNRYSLLDLSCLMWLVEAQ
jgi:hypothetical protein